jgi:hypothetical protein
MERVAEIAWLRTSGFLEDFEAHAVDPILDVASIDQHVRSLEVSVQMLNAFPLLDDGYGLRVFLLRR